MFGLGVGGCIADSFDTHVCQGEIKVVEARGLIDNVSRASSHTGLRTGT